jgi:hypothetical protein
MLLHFNFNHFTIFEDGMHITLKDSDFSNSNIVVHQSQLSHIC